jgi:hypothetical protein
MRFDWLSRLRKYALGTCVALAFGAGVCHAADNDELRALLEKQQQEIQELKQKLDGQAVMADGDKDAPKDTGRVVIDPASINKIIADYLKDNPGAGMPPGVQTGYSTATGFAIRSTNNPPYVNWQDESKIPFELRIRGRLQIPFYFYKVEDTFDHQRGRLTYPTATTQSGNGGLNAAANPNGVAGAASSGDFSQLEIKRMRLIFEGTVFDPNLRYHIQLDGTTRGLDGLAGGGGVQGIPGSAGNGVGGLTNTGGSGVAANGNGVVQVDHAVRLFSAYVAYDFHPCCGSKGCGEDCPEGSYKYTPTLTLIAGKLKPFFAFEEIMGSANEQFVEYGMTEWFFDLEDDNLMNWWGVQYKGMQDRLYAAAGITNGSESQFAARQMDDYPGFNCGFWYDFGGTWNESRHRYDLYGDCISDIDYSCKPVVRVGGAFNADWMDRRSLYTNAEEGRIRISAVQPGGANSALINILGGATGQTANNAAGSFSLDKFDVYSFEAFAAGKWRGFSVLTDWFFRDMDNFKGVKGVGGASQPITYNANIPGVVPGAATGINTATPALFNRGGMFDMGTQCQIGYFVVPKKLEVGFRWDWIHGQSGTLDGNGTARLGPIINGTRTIIVNDAFRAYHDSNEYDVVFNYFFRRQQVKWQTDIGYYQGGNPAAGGQSPSGYIPGTDGWLLRTQIQLAF